MLRSFIGAPPHTGLEQHLRPKRPQEPGGCVKNPIALHPLKLVYVSPCRTCLQRIIFELYIRYFHELWNLRNSARPSDWRTAIQGPPPLGARSVELGMPCR